MFAHSVLLVCGRGNKTLETLLFSLGIAPWIQHSLEGALRVVQRKPLDLILIDVRESDLDFVELVLNIRDVDEEVEILAVTPSGGGTIAARLERARNTEILASLDDPASLGKRLGVLLNRKKGGSPPPKEEEAGGESGPQGGEDREVRKTASTERMEG